MDENELIKEGHYAAFGTAGARTEMPGCSLCMDNQAQVREGATVVSTSTRNFSNRLGKNTHVFLARAELAAIASKLGHIPTVAEYHEAVPPVCLIDRSFFPEQLGVLTPIQEFSGTPS
jgi:aconitate hydratase 2/2-methylisocitrate dehydratase